jgi:hypothetical protein
MAIDGVASWVSAYALTNDYADGARLTSFAGVHARSGVFTWVQAVSTCSFFRTSA